MKKENFLAIPCFLLIIIIGFYFCSEKVGLYEDEIVTYGLANSHNASWIYNAKGLSGSDMRGVVLYNDDIISYLTVDESERFDYKSAYMNQTNDVHPPLYYLLINTVSSLVPGSYSKWIGLSINMIIWVAILFLIYRTVNLITGNKTASLISAMLYGISNGGLSCLLFIRMYILLAFFTMLLANQIVVLEKKNNRLSYLGIMISIFGGMMTQYSFVYFAFFICLLYGLIAIINKRFSVFFKLLYSSFSGVLLFVIAFPYIFSQIKNGANNGAVSGSALLNNLLNIKSWVFSVLLGFSCAFKSMVVTILFLLVCLSVLFILKITKKTTHSNKNSFINVENLIIIATVLALISISILNPGITDRYYYHLLPLVAFFTGCLLYKLFNNYWNKSFLESRKATVCNALYAMAVLLSVISVIVLRPSWIRKEYKQYYENLSTHRHTPAIYVASDRYFGVHDETLQFLAYSDSCIVTSLDSIKSDGVESYLNKQENSAEAIVYIDTLFENTDQALDTVIEKTGYKVKKELFSTGRTKAYVLYREV